MSFTKSFGRRALGALRGLVRSSKEVLKSKQTAKEPRGSVREQLQQVLSSSVGQRSRTAKPPRFVVLVFIHYTGWSRGSQESPESMQLDSVRNDFVEVLDYLHYRHGDEKTMWHLLTDFELDYTDGAGNTQRLPRTHPTGGAILEALTEAGKTGGSGLVYFGAHGEYAPPGTSVLKTSGDRTHYSTVNVQASAEPRSSFLIAIDGARIYGEDIFSRLPEDVPPKCVHTVAFDACHSAGVAGAATNVHHAYNGESPANSAASLQASPEIVNAEQRTSKQLVVISAARDGELARTIRPNGAISEYGKMTWTLIHWLRKHPGVGVQNVGKRLRRICVVDAKPGEEQHPEIFVRHPLALTESFELLPGLLRYSQDESRAAGRLGPLMISWSPPPRSAR